MKRILVALITFTLVATVWALPAAAVGETVYVYSSVSGKSWTYTGPDHWDAYQGNNRARDISGTTWTGNDNVTFTVDPYTTQGKVVQATVNCPTGGPDKYVMLELWNNGTMYGRVDYVHLRTLNVSVGQWITSGTVLGAIQNQTSSINGTTCWFNVHTHLGTDVGSWRSGGVQEVQPYSNWVLSYAFPGLRPVP